MFKKGGNKMFHRYGSEQGGFSEYLRRHYNSPQHIDKLEDTDDDHSPEEGDSETMDDNESIRRDFFLFQKRGRLAKGEKSISPRISIQVNILWFESVSIFLSGK